MDIQQQNFKSLAGAQIRLIAFYLPQYHPTPENDCWWGKGFTEWTNVASAKPLFQGHEQPKIPADLGFYDLRLPESRIAQAELASKYGVYGFCYWHYWFAGRRMLDRPFREVLASGEPKFPFCLGWANHSWNGIWKNEPFRRLIDQTYPGEVDDREHFRVLLEAFVDDRYITVDGSPLLVIFKPTGMPEPKRRFELWRELAAAAGLKGLYIVGVCKLEFQDAKALGLDAVIVSPLAVTKVHYDELNYISRLIWIQKSPYSSHGPHVVPYAETAKHLIPDLGDFPFEAHPCVIPNWDNTPRRGRNGLVLFNSSPEAYRYHLTNALSQVSARSPEHRIVFLKSWNEWGEGNYLEPDIKWGRRYLEVTKETLEIFK